MSRDFAPRLTGETSPEFRLVCAALRWPRDAARHAELATLVSGADFERVIAITARHRVEGLVAHALLQCGAELPAGGARHFAAVQHRTLRANLLFASETVRLHRLCAAEDVDMLFFKGATLAQLVYGTLAHKMAMDIDLLVAPADLPRVFALLRREEYRIVIPMGASDEELTRWIRVSHETTFRHNNHDAIVDVHGALVDNHRLLPGVGMTSPRQNVRIGGADIPTLATPDLYAYLCAHGAMAGWTRLKWMADVAALLAPLGPEGAADLHAHAEARGVGRCSAQVLMLASEMLGLALPPALDARLWRSGVNRKLTQVGFEAMTGEFELRQPMIGTTDTVPVLLSQFRLRPGIGYFATELARKLTNPVDRMKGVLPERLGFLYPLLSVSRWSTRQIARRLPGRARG